MATLKAFPDIVLVDRKGGQNNGTTSIVYSSDSIAHLIILWERFVGASWQRKGLSAPPIFNSPSGDPKRNGEYIVHMKPGQVYQVAMYQYPLQEFVNPNNNDPTDPNVEAKPEALVTVVAMLKDPEPKNLIEDQGENAGGTWFRKTVRTTVPTTFVLQASNTPPFKDAAGVERFAKPIATIFDLSNVDHSRVISPQRSPEKLEEPFYPGNSYFYLTRLVDGDGNWQLITGNFRTKQRTVRIDFEVLHIINDGAQNDTTAEFRIWVMEGNISVKDYFFGDVDNFEISDRPDPGKEDTEFIRLGDQANHAVSFCAPFILGPKDITDKTYEIGILTRGLVYRAIGSNEHVSNFAIGDNFPNPEASVPKTAKFPFRTGLGENMQHVPLVVRAESQTSDVQFKYDVTAFFTVNYT